MQEFTSGNNDPQFPSFLQGFNRRWKASNCEVIYLCHTTEDVRRALEKGTSLYGKNVKITITYA